MDARDDVSARPANGIGTWAVPIIAGLIVWAVALVVTQCATWLQTGIWQPVPAFALFLSPEAQTLHLGTTEGRLSPLKFVPSLASFDSLDALVIGVAGKQVGLAQIVHWLLDTALALWLVIAAVNFMVASAVIEVRSEVLSARKEVQRKAE